jgi:hypothetical protein
MLMPIWTAIHPRQTETRLLATVGCRQTLLKARLATSPHHPRALPTLLEALALWQGERVHAALVADAAATSSGTSLFTECFDVVEPTPLFKLELVDGKRPPRHRDRIDGLGHFRDLRQLLLREVAR